MDTTIISPLLFYIAFQMELLILYLKGVQTNPRGCVSHPPAARGSAPGHGSRTKLAQVYPYRFCSQLIRSLISYGNLRSLRPAQTLLVEELLECLTAEELQDVTENTQSLNMNMCIFRQRFLFLSRNIISDMQCIK